MGKKVDTEAEFRAYLKERSNWGRWGASDELGTLNLITPAKRAAAARLVRSGTTVSLSRMLSATPGPENARPALHGMRVFDLGYAKAAGDFFGMEFHAATSTHIDALCHYWDDAGLYNGKSPREQITFEGARFGGIEQWGDGIVTRGVLLDIPRLRGTLFVRQDQPVHCEDLEEAARRQGVSIGPGDALCVYSGREAWHAAAPQEHLIQAHRPMPGLHASCLPFLRERDISVLLWDLMDARPSGFSFGAPIHATIFAFGLALLDNALLEPLAQACAAAGQYEFLLVIAPLKIPGGTGSPVNPIAVL